MSKRLPDESFEDYKARQKKEQHEAEQYLSGSYLQSNKGLNHKDRSRILAIQRRAKKGGKRLPIDETMDKINQPVEKQQEAQQEPTGESGMVE